VGAKNDKVYIIGLNEGWFKVIYGEKICYIRSDYVDLTEIPYENRDSSNSPKFYRGGKSTGVTPSAAALKGNTSSGNTSSGNTSSGNTSGGNTATETVTVTGKAIVAEAEKYLGCPYVSGGASPSGFDCSGFVYYVLKQLGYSPYRTCEDLNTMGTYVSKENLQPGDIVVFQNTYKAGISHVGIYVGNGQFIHSPNSRSVVSYADLTTGYWANHYYSARRVVN
jgi:peptidoglycan endopeptidase LytE